MSNTVRPAKTILESFHFAKDKTFLFCKYWGTNQLKYCRKAGSNTSTLNPYVHFPSDAKLFYFGDALILSC